MTTKEDVIRAHLNHPGFNACMIARLLGCNDAYVRATLNRNGLTAARTRSGFRMSVPSESIAKLGRAARTAGLSVADIQKIAETRRAHALAMREES